MASNDRDRMRYIFGTNEGWNEHDSNITPAEALGIWTTYTQPVSQELGLKLLAPNVGKSKVQLDWFEDFLKQCWDTSACDVDLIKGVVVHEYDCRESYWVENYDESRGFFFADLLRRLGSYGGKDWSSWLSSQEIWVSETSCFWEDEQAHPNSVEHCKSITSQKAASHGMGSLQWLQKNARITRYAWWTVVFTDPAMAQSYMLDTGLRRITPAGAAVMNPVSSTIC